MQIDKTYPLGILFVASSGSPQTSDIIVPVETLSASNSLYFVYGNSSYYTSLEEARGIKYAEINTTDGNSISASIIGSSSVSPSDFTVTDSSGSSLAVTSASISDITASITVSGGNASKSPYTVTYGGKSVFATVSAEVVDSVMVYDGNDLGCTFTNTSSVSFKAWAPLASSVKLLLFADSSSVSGDPAQITDMALGTKGVWSVSGVDCSSYKYYKYRFNNSGSTYDVCDIWAKAASADSVASQIVNINDGTSGVVTGATETYDGTADNYKNPWSGTNYTQAVIYEIHIRDWSRAFVSTSTGKFDDITDALNSSDGKFYEHLKNLGITHVQILPMFDYAQLNSDTIYNWGYNPYNWNVPEGRYVNNDSDGTDAVLQMRHMIQAFHDAGIAVNMDVVYNHTNGTGINSLYDMTVPKYFYRMNGSNYSNGSGCGNEVATNHTMVRKFVIDSLRHWMLDYHINGFRFDVMGCHETSTMKEIYSELRKIDPNVMVYGEPWTGGTSLVVDGCTKSTIDECWNNTADNGVGCFDDGFRDGIKGAEYGGFKQGEVQGIFNDSAIITGLKGSTTADNGFTGRIGRGINYAECHDNYTLFDKLAMSALKVTTYSGDLRSKVTSADLMDTVKAEDKLAAAYMLLAQGTPFINGGQEFLRTKRGNSNSYTSSDTVNQINLKDKTTYSDVYNTYKGLIALRKTYSAFTSASSVSAESLTKGVIKYTADNFVVLFNATDSNYTCTPVNGYAVSISTGSVSIASEKTDTVSIPYKNFVIIKTN